MGKKLQDILFEDSSFHGFSVSYSPFSSSVTINEQGQILGELAFQGSLRSLTSDLRFRSDNSGLMCATIKSVSPGFLRGLTFISTFNGLNYGQCELQLRQKYASLSASLGNPNANVSAVVGSTTLALGTSVSVNATTGVVNDVRGCLSIGSENGLTAGSLSLNEMGDSCKASFYHREIFNTVIGGECEHRFATGNNLLTLGVHHLLDSSTSITAHVNNDGRVYGRITHSIITLAGLVNVRGDEAARFGISITIP